MFFIIYFKNKSKNHSIEKKPLYADTLIPKGYVLVPVELINIHAVRGLIDQYGLIDLYTGSENKSLKIASRIKLIRAPLNPNQYAVMVPEQLSREVMKYKDILWAVVLNRLTEDQPESQNKHRPLTDHLIQQEFPKKNKLHSVEIEYYQNEEIEPVL